MEKMPVQPRRWPFDSRKAATLPYIVCMPSKIRLGKTWPAREYSRNIGTFHASSPRAQVDLAASEKESSRFPPCRHYAPNYVTPCCSCRSCGRLNHQPQKIVSRVAALRKHDPTIALIPIQSVTASRMGEIRGCVEDGHILTRVLCHLLVFNASICACVA